MGVYGLPYNRIASGRSPFQKLKFPIGGIGARDHKPDLTLKERFRATSVEYVRLEIQKIGHIATDGWEGRRGFDILELIHRKTKECLGSADV
jgi:hypothetical protein